ncbi:MAG: type II toxin-antitoxin system HicB family antitoxin [Actinobacteria bacterium]|nr:type II toxin-antitoxin system HicB family antitoxin [Actinomycetota bacterium]
MTYRVDVRRDETGAWIADVPDVPGCHSYGRTLRQVRTRIREALALWVDDAESAELDWRVHLPAEARGELRAAHTSRERASQAQEEAQARVASAAQELVGRFGLSLRDAAELMGLSHQRVQQVLAAGSHPGRT